MFLEKEGKNSEISSSLISINASNECQKFKQNLLHNKKAQRTKNNQKIFQNQNGVSQRMYRDKEK